MLSRLELIECGHRSGPRLRSNNFTGHCCSNCGHAETLHSDYMSSMIWFKSYRAGVQRQNYKKWLKFKEISGNSTLKVRNVHLQCSKRLVATDARPITLNNHTCRVLLEGGCLKTIQATTTRENYLQPFFVRVKGIKAKCRRIWCFAMRHLCRSLSGNIKFTLIVKKKKSSCVQTFSAKFWHAYRHSTTKVKLWLRGARCALLSNLRASCAHKHPSPSCPLLVHIHYSHVSIIAVWKWRSYAEVKHLH